MLTVFRSLKNLCFSELMLVYQEGNYENAECLYPESDLQEGIIYAEQDFYTYLNDCFFRTDGAFYAVWVESGKYISALRMEPYRDGYLLEALETHPDFRCCGYAKKLILETISIVQKPIYSHVNKENIPSLAVHRSCGFERISENAVYVDGSVSSRSCTMRFSRQQA